MSKNQEGAQPTDGTGAKELEQQVETALERVLARQLAPVMKLTDNPAAPKEQDPVGQGGSKYSIVFLSRKG